MGLIEWGKRKRKRLKKKKKKGTKKEKKNTKVSTYAQNIHMTRPLPSRAMNVNNIYNRASM